MLFELSVFCLFKCILNLFIIFSLYYVAQVCIIFFIFFWELYHLKYIYFLIIEEQYFATLIKVFIKTII